MPQAPLADKGKLCPLHKQDMSKVCHKCPWWTHLRGKHPQSNAEIDEWGCAIAWLPILMIENAQQSRSTGAAVESFRNEMVRANAVALTVLQHSGPLPGDGDNSPQLLPPMKTV